MKQIFVICLILFGVGTAYSQRFDDDVFTDKARYPFAIGPYITYSGGINAADVPDGLKNRFLIADMVDFGVSVFYPFNKEQEIGMMLDLGMHNYMIGFETDPGEVQSDYQYNYLAFNPSLWFKSFRIGLNLGFPMGGTYVPDNENTENDIEVKTDQMTSPMIGLSLGAYIPILENGSGRLNFVLNASYALTGMIDSDFVDDGDKNQHPAAVRLGFSYLFNLEPSTLD